MFRRFWRWLSTIEGKIVLVITLISVVILTATGTMAVLIPPDKGRGQFLEKHYKRFDGYRRGLGQGLAANASFVAQAPSLITQLNGATETDSVALFMGLVRTGQENAATAIGEAVARAEELPEATPAFERVVTSVSRTIEPDLVFAFDEGREIHGESDITEAEANRSRLFSDVLGGITVVGELAILGGQVYQVSAAPVRNSDGEVIGGVVLGQIIERYMQDYQGQSGDNPLKQHRPAFLDIHGQVLSSVFPADRVAALGDALSVETYPREEEGLGKTVPVIHVTRGDGSIERLDFWAETVHGYSGQEYGEIGQMFLLRNREFKIAERNERLGWMLLAFAFVGILAIGVGRWLSRVITRRIEQYVSATDDLAQGQGDLTRRLKVGGKDELGHLATNLNAVFGYIHDLAANVQNSAFQVGASSAEISAASRQMLDGAQEQARKTESSSAAVTELSASIQQVAENAMEATRVARSSGEAVQDAIARMNEIRETVEDAASRIHDLGESGKRIGNIVEVIRQISDQTTLLALNAAIEAAHAGEQGRGFAVVADEVSGLAKRVGQSARDIEDLIATIKEQTAAAVKAMETGTQKVEAGTLLVTTTLSDLQTLVGVVEDTAAAVQEQAVASDEIARNMDVVQSIAQDVLGSSEEAVSQGEHLHRLAFNLEESVKGFKINAAESPSESPRALPSGEN
ncbi:MAG: methyl-accepting chemotaxis protein [Deltaproteobacteria bacterium]|nr:methyl-accepting chemotaxis protein [Deltaproteobacteria bacterium]